MRETKRNRPKGEILMIKKESTVDSSSSHCPVIKSSWSLVITSSCLAIVEMVSSKASLIYSSLNINPAHPQN